MPLCALLALAAGLSGCHRPPRPWDPDPRLPAAFNSPEATFHTWTAASRSGNRKRVRECYWDGLGPEELGAWLTENLRPEAESLFSGAGWLGCEPVTPVEVNFSFAAGDGQELRGVMVRTAGGWKLQRW